jgi:hypothetical protein
MVRVPDQCSADKLPTFYHHCLLSVRIDQLSKADAPFIPETYIYLLGMQCFVSLSDGLAGYAFPLYNTLAVQKPPAASTEPVRAPAHSTLLRCLKPNQPGQGHKLCARDAERRLASCGPLLPPYHQPLRLHFRWASYSRRAADARPGRRRLAQPTPRDAFHSTLALPPRVVAALDEPQQASSHLKGSRLVWREMAEVAPHRNYRDLARAIWHAYGRSSSPRFS